MFTSKEMIMYDIESDQSFVTLSLQKIEANDYNEERWNETSVVNAFAYNLRQ